MDKIPEPTLLIITFLHACLWILFRLKLTDPSLCPASPAYWKGSLYVCGLPVLKAGNQLYILYMIDSESIKHQTKVALDASSEMTVDHVMGIQVY